MFLLLSGYEAAWLDGQPRVHVGMYMYVVALVLQHCDCGFYNGTFLLAQLLFSIPILLLSFKDKVTLQKWPLSNYFMNE